MPTQTQAPDIHDVERPASLSVTVTKAFDAEVVETQESDTYEVTVEPRPGWYLELVPSPAPNGLRIRAIPLSALSDEALDAAGAELLKRDESGDVAHLAALNQEHARRLWVTEA